MSARGQDEPSVLVESRSHNSPNAFQQPEDKTGFAFRYVFNVSVDDLIPFGIHFKPVSKYRLDINFHPLTFL